MHDTPSAIPKFARYPTQSNVIVDLPATTTVRGIAAFISENYCGSVNLYDATVGLFTPDFQLQGSATSSNPREVLYANSTGVTLLPGHTYHLVFGCNARTESWYGSSADVYGSAISQAGHSQLGRSFGADADVADYSFALCDSIDCRLETAPVVGTP